MAFFVFTPYAISMEGTAGLTGGGQTSAWAESSLSTHFTIVVDVTTWL